MKGIEPSYSAWKSENLVVFSKAVLTFSVFLAHLRSLQNFSLSEWRLRAPWLNIRLDRTDRSKAGIRNTRFLRLVERSIPRLAA